MDDLKEALQKILHFGLWIVAGIFVLPCVYIATVYYPMWEKWGENF
jgi:hypothetical protein